MNRISLLLLCFLTAPSVGCNLFEAVGTDTGSDEDAGSRDAGTIDDDMRTDATSSTDVGFDFQFDCDQPIAEFCASHDAECGTLTAEHACGGVGTANCGRCEAPETCGGGGVDNQCGCMPESDEEFCTRLGSDCGEVTDADNCGEMRTVACGTCDEPTMCGVENLNVCGCVEADLCGFLTTECGTVQVSDVCPNLDSVDCGACGAGTVCEGGRCAPEFAGAVPPVEIDGASSCTTNAFLTRQIAIDDGDVLYAAFNCSGMVHVSRSETGGSTWEPPVDTGVPTSNAVTLAGGDSGHVYLASLDGNGVQFAYSTDYGASWSAAQELAPDAFSSWLSITEHDGTVFVAHNDTGELRIHRDPDGGAGAFDSVAVPVNNAYGDVLVDTTTDDVWAVGDAPALEAARSSDDGQTFETPIDVGDSLYYSDWAIGNGEIFALGGADLAMAGSLELLVGDPASFRSVTGFATASTSSEHAVCASEDGTAFALLKASDGLNLQRVPAMANQPEAPILIDADATSASCIAGPDGHVAVVYTSGGEVYATVLKP
jgi:hypothetical protein